MDETTRFNVSYCTDPVFKLNVLKKFSGEKCDVCLMNEKNPLRYGEFIEKRHYTHRTLRVHYFCLLSSNYIPQNCSTNCGIAGFAIRDIIKSFKQFRENKCFYCQHPSAAIKCAASECDRHFHYICGYKNSCLTQFSDQFLSYCEQHLPAEYRKPFNTKSETCDVCFVDLPQITEADFNPLSVVRTRCDSECPKGMMHRECVQRFAYTSGYNFKCPLCWNKKFRQHAAESGIFVPERESAWEREPGAFKDLHKRKCTATDCVVGNKRRVIGCKVCGGQLKHKRCAGVADEKDYVCSVCQDESFVNIG